MSESKEKLDVIHHLLDTNVIEIFSLRIDLNQIFPKMELFGYDISITKNVLMMWIAAGLMLIIFPAICRRKSLVPTGLRNMFEAILLFVRDDVVYSCMDKKSGDSYLPYFWTLFFFIFFCNLLGLIPFSATATGNIAVTLTLALISFFFIHIAGMKQNGVVGYLKSIVPHVPLAIWPLLLIVEVMGHIIKPFALAVRLFANMTAGHVLIPVFLSFIVSLTGGLPAYVGYPIGILPLVMAIAITLLEILIAMIQAYIFTFLTAVFMGMAIHPDH
jgi:F-type H+-transporting ATPase subunit a